jgi:ubiquinone/menaquinone biosynthesis C-methylase UbiE
MELQVPRIAKRIARYLGIKKPKLHAVPAVESLPLLPENTQFWCDSNVTKHKQFTSVEASLEYFHWRNGIYHNYIELMPVTGQDDKAVLDYGCGPGNDLVGFSVFSRPSRLIGMDISVRSLAEAKDRVALHSDQVEIKPIIESDNRIPLDDGSIDYLHSSGVVHHAIDPASVLREFRRVLKPSGRCRVMVYNYDSIWLHLWVAYIKMIKQNAFPGLDLRAAFGKSTDGDQCPISRVYRPHEFIELAESCGFECRYLGAAVSTEEIIYLGQYRFEAIQEVRLAREHRDFLWALTMDTRGCPMFNGAYAGVDGCYELIPVLQ